MNLASARKMFVAVLIVAAGTLGIEYANLDWWTNFVTVVVTGVVVYWTKNEPGSLLNKSETRNISDPRR